MNLIRMIAAVAALSMIAVAPADAASKTKRYKPQRVVVYPAPSYWAGGPQYWVGTPRPPWAQPWECFTDEGYGRYRPCGAGRF
jgi:hypothetical protein